MTISLTFSNLPTSDPLLILNSESKIKNVVESLEVENAGIKVPQAAVFDLKTRSSYKKGIDILSEELPRLWITQISNFIVAYHDRGIFNDIRIEDTSAKIKKWESENQQELKKLDLVLQRIFSIAKQREDGKLEIRWNGEDDLEMREQDSEEHDVLSQRLKHRWLKESISQNSHTTIRDKEERDSANPRIKLCNPRDQVILSHENYETDKEEYNNSEKLDYEVLDYTACSANGCGYCGRCEY